MVPIEFRAPILSLACKAWVEMMPLLLRVGLGAWVRGSRGSLRTEERRRPLEESLEAMRLILSRKLKDGSSQCSPDPFQCIDTIFCHHCLGFS